MAQLSEQASAGRAPIDYVAARARTVGKHETEDPPPRARPPTRIDQAPDRVAAPASSAITCADALMARCMSRPHSNGPSGSARLDTTTGRDGPAKALKPRPVSEPIIDFGRIADHLAVPPIWRRTLPKSKGKPGRAAPFAIASVTGRHQQMGWTLLGRPITASRLHDSRRPAGLA